MNVSVGHSPLLDKIVLLRPAHALDVGCGCGEETVKLARYCGRITAIDISELLIERCKRESTSDNITYARMDGRDMAFPENSFELVMESHSLHHTENWQEMLAEMVRVSAEHVLLEEPVDDPRSEAKQNAMRLQKLMLEVQREVGYSHFEHIKVEAFRDTLKTLPVKCDFEITKRDDLVDIHEYEVPFNFFAERSQRKEYWLARFSDMKIELAGKGLSKTDILCVSATKQRI